VNALRQGESGGRDRNDQQGSAHLTRQPETINIEELSTWLFGVRRLNSILPFLQFFVCPLTACRNMCPEPRLASKHIRIT
ncbi:uncharacterized protein METZ01_LOCUS493073, partial [marine metagenome]